MNKQKILANNLTPFELTHPGDVVKEELAYRGISQKFFAQVIGVSYTMLNDILNGKRPISTDFALTLEAATGISAEMLVNMQTRYNLQVARSKKENISRWEKLRKIARQYFSSLMDNHKISIREINPSELGVLRELLYEAIYQPDEQNPVPKSVLQVPEVYAYIKDFGTQKDDYCLVAESEGKIIGAVWVRILSGEIRGYGNVDDETPEFSISLFKEYRNKGIGFLLMTKMIEYLKSNGYKQASLSVQKENYAVKLYKNLGFKTIKENENECLMMLKLN